MTIARTSANSFRLATIGTNRLARLLGDWATGAGPLHDQLTAQMRHLIDIGTLASGTRLPSERSLSQSLGVSRNTVTKSFDTLRSEGHLSSRQGDGTYVSTTRRTGS